MSYEFSPFFSSPKKAQQFKDFDPEKIMKYFFLNRYSPQITTALIILNK